jgi:hypothetical protein
MPDAPGAVRTSLTGVVASSNPWNVTFSPGVPLEPSQQQPVRGWDFPVNFNSTVRPRPYTPFEFKHLRAFSNVEMVRMAIETRKDQIERQDWTIKPKDNKKSSDSRIKELTTFWAKPDGVTPFPTFMRALLEDLLAIDAPTAEKRRTRGGKLIGLEYIPGDTIAIKVDDTGRIPRGPNDVAFQQIIKGTVWNDLSNRDILYVPRNVRPGHIYGFSPVEQIVVTINTIVRRQAAQLAHFTASNVPSGLLNAPEGWNLDKIKELQDWLDDKVTGNTSDQAKILWGPAGSKYQAFKNDPIKDDFDEWLARVVAFAFSLPPTPFVRQMNKGTANEDQDRALEEGFEPLKLWAKRWIDDIIAVEFGAPDLEFVFIDTPSIDPKVQADIDDKNLRNLTTTIDEVRDARGQDPLPDGQGKQPILITTTGVMTLADALAPKPEAMVEPPVPVHLDENGNPAAPPAPAAPNDPKSPAKSPAKPAAPTEKLAKANTLISIARPKARRHIAAISKALRPILARVGDEVAADVAKALKAVSKADGEDNDQKADDLANAADLSGMAGMGEAIEEELADVATDSGQIAITTILGQPEKSIVDRVFGRAVDYAKKRSAELVSVDGDQSIVESTRAMIRATIAQGLSDNIGGDAIATALQESYAFSSARANTIATTEIAMANAAGKNAGWLAAVGAGAQLVKGWTITSLGNCCDDCQNNFADGEIPIDEPFSSGDEMEPAHPNCQCCTYARVVKADD